VTLVSSSLAAAYDVECVDPVVFEGLENLYLRFTRRDVNRVDLPPCFYVLNCYVVAQPAAFDSPALFFKLDAMFLSLDAPVVLLGDFNAHWQVARNQLPTP
jgi:hypothetical protein